jgi:hypothetical protein
MLQTELREGEEGAKSAASCGSVGWGGGGGANAFQGVTRGQHSSFRSREENGKGQGWVSTMPMPGLLGEMERFPLLTGENLRG